MTNNEQCGDDRFEIINETKQYIINATNIDTSPEEMAVLDSICFRLWQLGLTKRNKDKLKELTQNLTFNECIKEWEERGWKVSEDGYFKTITFIKGDIGICFDIKEKYYFTFQTSLEHNSFYIDFDLHNLIHKTLKALEVENDKN